MSWEGQEGITVVCLALGTEPATEIMWPKIS
jgi:hypothetical protein